MKHLNIKTGLRKFKAEAKLDQLECNLEGKVLTNLALSQASLYEY